MTSWPMHAAKNRLGEVLDKARSEGPQIITRHGRAECAVISVEELQALQEREAGRELSAKDVILMREPTSDFFAEVVEHERKQPRRWRFRKPLTFG